MLPRIELQESAVETASNTSAEDEKGPMWTSGGLHQGGVAVTLEDERLTERQSSPLKTDEENTISGDCVWCQFEIGRTLCAFFVRM